MSGYIYIHTHKHTYTHTWIGEHFTCLFISTSCLSPCLRVCYPLFTVCCVCSLRCLKGWSRPLFLPSSPLTLHIFPLPLIFFPSHSFSLLPVFIFLYHPLPPPPCLFSSCFSPRISHSHFSLPTLLISSHFASPNSSLHLPFSLHLSSPLPIFFSPFSPLILKPCVS